MKELLLDILGESIEITSLVLLMMILVDLTNVWTHGKLASFLETSGRWKQYITSSFLGATPGCVGSFAGVSLYVHGMIGFGSVVGMMLATSGDEAYIMLAMIPKTAIFLFAILFVLGIFAGKITDFLIKKFNIQTCTDCEVKQYHKEEHGYVHYLKEHIWNHIIKHHIWKIFLWTFGALLFVGLAMKFLDLKQITTEYKLAMIFISALIGLIPESGPNLIIISMFANGLVPFSVLLTNSIVQDGHGLLPMLSYSVRDSVYVKIFNLFFGLVIGLSIYFLGY